MFSLFAAKAYMATKNGTDPIEWTEHTPVADPTIHIEGNILYIGDLRFLILAYAGGDTLTMGRLDAPSLRSICLNDLFPLSADVNPKEKVAYEFRGASALPLVKGEGLKIETHQPYTDNVTVCSAIILADAAPAPVTAPYHTIRYEGTITTEAWKWGNTELTVIQTLPVGRYRVIGAACRAPGGVFFRLIPVGAAHRPGGLIQSSPDDRAFAESRGGRMGVWFEFDSTTPPSLEILAPSNVGSYQLYMDLIKLS